MATATVGSFRDLVELAVTGVSILGGLMAFHSGAEASRSIRMREGPEKVAFRINEGLAIGFDVGLPTALIAVTLLALI